MEKVLSVLFGPVRKFIDTIRLKSSTVWMLVVTAVIGVQYLVLNPSLTHLSVPALVGQGVLLLTTALLGTVPSVPTSAPGEAPWYLKWLVPLAARLKLASGFAFTLIGSCLAIGYSALMYASANGWHINNTILQGAAFLVLLFSNNYLQKTK